MTPPRNPNPDIQPDAPPAHGSPWERVWNWLQIWRFDDRKDSVRPVMDRELLDARCSILRRILQAPTPGEDVHGEISGDDTLILDDGAFPQDWHPGTRVAVRRALTEDHPVRQWYEAEVQAMRDEHPPAPSDVTELCLCESSRLHLRPDQLYRFTVDPDCELCVRALADAQIPDAPTPSEDPEGVVEPVEGDPWKAMIAAAESLEDDAAEKLANDALGRHEHGFLRGQKITAKRLRNIAGELRREATRRARTQPDEGGGGKANGT